MSLKAFQAVPLLYNRHDVGPRWALSRDIGFDVHRGPILETAVLLPYSRNKLTKLPQKIFLATFYQLNRRYDMNHVLFLGLENDEMLLHDAWILS